MVDNKKVKKEPEERARCRWCHKNDGLINYYIIADDVDNPRLYHIGCMEELKRLADENIKLIRDKE